MKNNKMKIEILKTITLVMCVFIVGVLLTACQSSMKLKGVSLPSKENPLISKSASASDFEYPTKDPSIVEGKNIFQNSCAQCHGFKDHKVHNFDVKYINKVTPSELFKIITNNKNHPSFKEKLSIKERWDVVMYIRSEVFGLPKNYDDIKTKFGSNCAVCHGTRGFADGNLHYFLNPSPANFNQFDRLYERTDEKIFDEIKYGIAWTAMPPWGGRHDKDKNFDFDDEFIWELVKYVRTFGYSTEKDELRDPKLFKSESIE